jgi:hypothetical protein
MLSKDFPSGCIVVGNGMTRSGETAILAMASKTSDLVGLKQMIIRLGETAKRDQRSGRENEFSVAEPLRRKPEPRRVDLENIRSIVRNLDDPEE